jgi:hypothetical protein
MRRLVPFQLLMLVMLLVTACSSSSDPEAGGRLGNRVVREPVRRRGNAVRLRTGLHEGQRRSAERELDLDPTVEKHQRHSTNAHLVGLAGFEPAAA